MGGRKPLPTQVKQIKGTLQPCRTNYHEPVPEGLLVEPPDYMPEGAKAAWRYALECAPPTLIRKLDMSVLEVWACAIDLLLTQLPVQRLVSTFRDKHLVVPAVPHRMIQAFRIVDQVLLDRVLGGSRLKSTLVDPGKRQTFTAS